MANKRTKLYETHGYCSEMPDIIQAIGEYVNKYAKITYVNDTIRFFEKVDFEIPENVIDHIQDKPFAGIKVNVTIVNPNTPNACNDSVYYPTKSVLTDKGFIPHFRLYLLARQDNDYTKDIYVTMMHELTHAYDDIKSVISRGAYKPNGDFGELSKQHGILSVYYTDYARIQRGMKYFPDNFVFDFLYVTSRIESNAFISELKPLIDLHKNQCRNRKDFINVLKCSASYQFLKDTGKYFTNLINKYESFGYSSDDVVEAIAAYNAVYKNNKVTTFNQFIKMIQQRASRFKKQFYKQGYKIIGDTIMEMNQGL